MVRTSSAAFAIGCGLLFVPAVAAAHISVASGFGVANTSQEVTFGVGHGCSGADTFAVQIEIPAGVTSVRPETSDFGRATVATDNTGNVTSVSWQKPDANLLDSDTNYYKLTIRMKLPNQPFTKLVFPAHQTCKSPDGGVTVVDWTATVPNAGGEPAPTLAVVSAHKAGWNKITIPTDISDLSVYFGDAVIVWKDSAAYSANADTANLISTTTGVTALTSLATNDVVWVRY